MDDALEEIRPYVINDGGKIEVVGVSEEDGVAVRLLGRRSGASSQQMMKGVGRIGLAQDVWREAMKRINVNGDVGQALPELTKDVETT